MLGYLNLIFVFNKQEHRYFVPNSPIVELKKGGLQCLPEGIEPEASRYDLKSTGYDSKSKGVELMPAGYDPKSKGVESMSKGYGPKSKEVQLTSTG